MDITDVLPAGSLSLGKNSKRGILSLRQGAMLFAGIYEAYGLSAFAATSTLAEMGRNIRAICSTDLGGKQLTTFEALQHLRASCDEPTTKKS